MREIWALNGWIAVGPLLTNALLSNGIVWRAFLTMDKLETTMELLRKRE